MSVSKKTPHHFSADRPRLHTSEDLLGRENFAQEMADSLESWAGEDSLVIGLYGEWGVGKTTLKNFILEKLPPETTVLEFNPWDWSAHGKIAEGFFREIGIALGEDDEIQNAKEQAAEWSRISARLGYVDYATTGLRKATVWVAGLLGSTALVSASLKEQLGAVFSSTLVLIVGIVLLAVAGLIHWGQGLIQILEASGVRRITALNNISLASHKKKMSKLLLTRPKPLIVILDDIDRLTPAESVQVVQLIKANADFPRLVFLLLCQRDILENNLNLATKLNGQAYLEKIVQVAIDIPKAERHEVHRALVKGLDRLKADPVIAKYYSEEHWREMFKGLGFWFQNLRQVARFLGAFSFHVQLFKRENSFEVNFVDLAAIEALRMFEPKLHSTLHQNKLFLLGLQFSEPGVQERVAEELLAFFDEESRDSGLLLLAALFPPISQAMGKSRHTQQASANRWFRESRICSEHVFERYFLLATEHDGISQQDFDRILKSLNDKATTCQTLRTYIDFGQIETLLERLAAYKFNFEENVAIQLVGALFDVGDDFPDEPTSASKDSACKIAGDLTEWLLKYLKTKKQSQQIFIKATMQTIGLWMPAQKLEIYSQKTAPESMLFLTDSQVSEIQNVVLKRIIDAANSGSLFSNAARYKLVRYWDKFSDGKALHQWSSDYVSTFETALVFLRCWMTGTTQEKVLDLENAAKAVDITAVHSLLEGGDPSNLEDDLAEVLFLYHAERSKISNDSSPQVKEET